MRRSSPIAVAVATLVVVGGLAAPSAATLAAPETTRVAGSDRIGTAIALSEATFARADEAVVAAADRFADALAAAPLASAVGGPVLLNPTTGLDPRVRRELERLGADRVLVLGGTGALSNLVADGLRAAGHTVERVAGPDRFATAAAAALRARDEWRARGDAAAGRHVLVALGSHPTDEDRAWPDALVAGVLAGHAHRPILLTARDAVPVATADAIADLGASTITVIGGTAAIPAATAAALGSAGATVRRIGGPTRYHTAARVADEAVAAGASRSQLVVSTGERFPDALAAASAAVERGGVLLLVAGGDLDASSGSRDWLREHRGRVAEITIVGGSAVVSSPVVEQVAWATDGFTRPRLRLTKVLDADVPLGLVSPPDSDQLVVWERGGRIRIRDAAGRWHTFLDLGAKVRSDGERGLLGVAFHPGYASNGRLFVHYSRAADGDTVVEEYRRSSSTRADPRSGFVQLVVRQFASNHNGGTLAFGPDRMLHLFLGDGGGGGDPRGNGQDPDTRLGAVLRLDVQRPGTYRIPPDNPFADGRRGDPLVWATGLRNPYRASFDAVTGLLYIADVGQSGWEEIDVQPAARPAVNYGWNTMEGNHCFSPSTGCRRDGLTPPVLEYATGPGGTCAVIGGHVYRGSIGMLRGHYLYADWCAGWVRSFRYVDGEATERTDWSADLDVGGMVYGFGIDGDGEVYVLSRTAVHRITRR